MGVLSFEAPAPAAASPLISAAAAGDDATVRRCLQAGVNAEIRDEGGDTALAAAALQGKLTTCELLLQAGADAEAVNRATGDTVLMWAAATGIPEIIELLLRHGANVNAINKQGYSPLYRACYKNHPVAVRLLLAAGADVTQKTTIGGGKTVLDCARENRHDECAYWIAAFMREDLVEMEKVKIMWPEASSNYIQLPSPELIGGRAPSPQKRG